MKRSTLAGHSPPDPRRVAAWRALSQLFLDTELDARDIASIAQQLRETDIPAGELERIYAEEVAPACWKNAHAVPGGAWSSFDEAWLLDAVQRGIVQHERLDCWPVVKRWRVAQWTKLTRDDWMRVRSELERSSPASGPG